MTPRLILALQALLLVGLPGGAAKAAQGDQQMRALQSAAQIDFQTLDGDLLQVNSEEIWRVRAALASDEPAGSIVVDYGFERIYVKDSLDNVVEQIKAKRDMRKFTLPSGGPIYIAPDKIIGINRPIPTQHHQKSQSIIIAKEGQQQVQESRQSISEVLK